jgi:hypothetical protein
MTISASKLNLYNETAAPTWPKKSGFYNGYTLFCTVNESWRHFH